MINVENLTKRYGSVTAVDSVTFQVQKGDIAGFLGPNGAGKSTTMRMLSCFLPPTSGKAEIAGFDVFTESLRVREHIGYLPENVPLPLDMRVGEYLSYRARLKGVPGRRVRERVGDVCELCSLTDMDRRMIGTLSKGYRQRVGIADAMVHEPDLLILDEPTIGLDPNQIRQMRELIKNLSRHHTILLSTHILPEVEMTCTRVLIINQGRIEALDTPQNLRDRLRSKGDIFFEIKTARSKEASEILKSLPDISSVTVKSEKEEWVRFALAADSDVRELLHETAVKQKWPVRELSRRKVTLEEVFAEVTHQEDL